MGLMILLEKIMMESRMRTKQTEKQVTMPMKSKYHV